MKNKKEKSLRIDSLQNILKGFGTQRDWKFSTMVKAGRELSDDEKENLWRYNGFMRRIVDFISETMIREGFEIDIDKENKIYDKLVDLDFNRKMKNLIQYSFVFGGAVCVMKIDDGNFLSDPVDEESIDSVSGFRVYDRRQVTDIVIDKDPDSKTFGEILQYRINPFISGVQEFYVHSSRVLRLDGEDVTDQVRFSSGNLGFGDSICNKIFDQIHNLSVCYSAIADCIVDANVPVLKIQNLMELSASGRDDMIHKRLNLINQGRSTLKTILLDNEEIYEKVVSNLSGLDAIVREKAVALSCVSNVPLSVFMGRQAGGLGSDNDNDLRSFYDYISNQQEWKLLKIFTRAVTLIAKSSELGFKSDEIENITIKFNPLWQSSDREKAETRRIQSEVDKLYVTEMGVPSEWINQQRFGKGEYSYEMSFTDDQIKIFEEDAQEVSDRYSQQEKLINQLKSEISSLNLKLMREKEIAKPVEIEVEYDKNGKEEN